MFFSIVIPVYNVERYLRECLDSVIAQTCGDWEVVLVDDGSTDGSAVICDDFASGYPEPAFVVHQDNKGLLAARRAGLRATHGEVIVSLDSDDKLRLDALERIKSAFDEHGVDMVVFGHTRAEDFSSLGGQEPFTDSVLVADKASLARRLCTSPTLNSMCAKAVRRECMDVDADYSRYGGLSYAEDRLQTFPIVDAVRSAYYLHEPLYYYRVNYGSLTKRFTMAQLEAREAVHEVELEYARRWAGELRDETLVEGIYSLGLNSYAEVAQSACESLPRGEATAVLRRLADTPEFRECYDRPGCLDGLRRDFRHIASLLYRRGYLRIWAFSRAKGSLRRALGR